MTLSEKSRNRSSADIAGFGSGRFEWLRRPLASNPRLFGSVSVLAILASAMLAWFFSATDADRLEYISESDAGGQAIERTLARTLLESRTGVQSSVLEAPPDSEQPSGTVKDTPASNPMSATPPEGYEFVSHQGRMQRAPFARHVPLEPDPNPAWLDPSVALERLQRQAQKAGRDWTFAAARLAPGARRASLAQSLAPLGARLEGISGEYARVRVPADSNTLNAITSLQQVLGLGAMPSELKVAPEFAQQAITHPSGERIPVFITLMADDPTGEWRKPLADMGLTVGAYDPDLRSYTANMPYGALASLADADFVMAIEPVSVVRAAHDTAVPVMGADGLREYDYSTSRFTGVTGNGIPIGVLDTGLSTRHVDISTGRSSICGANMVHGEQTDLWNDHDGHGTLVTGTLVGAGKDQPKLAGMAPNASHIRFAKVLSRTGRGTHDDVRRGMSTLAHSSSCTWNGQASASVKPFVVNMSLAASGIRYSGRGVEERKLDSVVYGYGQLYVVAQANAGTLAFSNFGTAKNSLAVGAVDDGGIIAEFSSHGPTADGRLAPSLVGTGVDIVSTAGRNRPTGYEQASGTSFASPAVAGLAALLMEAETDFQEQPALVRARLMASAIRPDAFLEGPDEFPRNNTNGPGRLQNQYGLGLASARASILSRDTEQGWMLGSATSEPTSGAYEYLDIEVPEGASRLDIVMTWDEQPADTLTRSVLNNLDLWVDEGADCTEEPCGEYSSRSVRDSIEWLFIDDPAPGTHRIKVVPSRLYGDVVKAAIAWTLIRGDSTPQLNLQVDRTSIHVTQGEEFEILATVSANEYLSSGTTLHLGCRGGGGCSGIKSAWRAADSQVVREDGIARSLPSRLRFQDSAIALGEIAAGEERRIRLRFSPRSGAQGSHLQLTASAWNARSAVSNLVLNIVNEPSMATGASSSQASQGETGAPARAPPVNDDFADATQLAGTEGSSRLDLFAASREPGEPGVQANSRTAWYIWTAPRDGLFRFRLKEADRDRAAEADISLYTGERLVSLESSASKQGSELTFTAQEGLVYKLRISKAAWSLPEFLLEWEPADLRPPNDDFAFAQQISGERGQVEGSNEGATLEESEFWGGLAATVWYEWTAPSDGYRGFDTNVSERRVMAFTGDRLSDLRFIAETRPDTLTLFPAAEGEVYRIAVASGDADESGSPFTLSWFEPHESWLRQYADNDGFADAEVLEGIHGSVDHLGWVGLTVEPFEPLETGIATAWWQWTAPEDGTYTWRYGDSELFRLSVFTGDAIEALSPVASGSAGAAITFEAVADTTYYLALGRSPQAVNRFLYLPDLEWGKTPQNDARDEAIEVFGASGSVSGDPKYATAQANEPSDTWGGESIWWRWSVPSSGWYRFWIEEDPASIILSLYPMNQVGAASSGALASSERSFLANGRVEAHLLARAGDAYEIRLSHRFGMERIETATVHWEQTEAPVHLRYAGAVTNESLGGSPPPLFKPHSIAMHPDGERLFATSDNRLLGLQRDPASGDLSLAYRFDASSALASNAQVAFLGYSALHWDANHNRLFALRGVPYSFELQPDQSGLLAVDRVTLNGAITTNDLKIAAKPGSRILYLLESRVGPLQVVRIDSEREMTLIQTVRDRNASGDDELLVPSMKAPKDIAIASDGSHVYVVGEEVLNVFSSDATTGRLSLVRDILAGSEAESDGPFEGMGKLQNLVLDASGRYLFVTGMLPARVALFDLSEDSSNPNFVQSVTHFFRYGPNPFFPRVWRTLITARSFKNCEFAKPHGDRTAIDVLCQFGFYSVMWDPASEELRITDFANSGTTDRYGGLVPTLSRTWRQFAQSPDGKHLYVTTSQFNDYLPDAIQIFERASAMTVDDGSNHSPSVNQTLADQEATVGLAFSYQFSEATFADGDGESLSYTAQGLPVWLTFNAQTRTFSGTAEAEDVTLSPVVIAVMAADGVGASASTRFGLSVRAQESARNTSPVRNRELISQSTRAGEAFSYQFAADSFTDPDGDSLTYSATGMPTWLSFTPATRTFAGTPTAADVTATALSITVTATDPAGASGRSSFQLTVLAASDTQDTTPEFPATAGPGDQTFAVDTEIPALTLPEATGGDGTLAYSLSPAVPGLSFDAAARLLTGTPTAAGVHSTTYTVTDADGDTDSLSFTITVQSGDAGTNTDLGDCRIGLLVRPGQSCTYPGTDDAFSVGEDGRGMFLIITSARAININKVTYKGTYYDFRAEHEGDGIWRIDRLDGSTTPTT